MDAAGSPGPTSPSGPGLLEGPHLTVRLRSSATRRVPERRADVVALVDAVPANGWRGRLVQSALRAAARVVPVGRLGALPLVERTDELVVPFGAERVAGVLAEVEARCRTRVVDAVWFLPPPEHGARLGAVLIGESGPLVHLRLRERVAETVVEGIEPPRPDRDEGPRTGVVWPRVLARWTDEGVAVELSSVLTVGRHVPASPSLTELVALVDDLTEVLGPRRGGRSPMHGDLTPWNLRVDRRGRGVLFDWEHAGYGPVDADLVRYLSVAPGGDERFAELPAWRRERAAEAVTYWREIARAREADQVAARWKRGDRAAELDRLARLATLSGAS